MITELPDTVSGNIRFLHREGCPGFIRGTVTAGVPVEQRALPSIVKVNQLSSVRCIWGCYQANTRLGMEGTPVGQRPLRVAR